MSATKQTPPSIAAEPPRRRATDVATVSPLAEDDPERWYEELRAGKRSIQSLVPLLPLNVAFLWHSQHRLSAAEFAALMAGMDVLEVEIGDLPTQKACEPDAEQQRANAVIAAFNSRMANFDAISLPDDIGELELKPVLAARTPLAEGIGIRMAFAKGPQDGLAKAGTPPELTLTCRAFIASTSMVSAIKCEAVFSAPTMERDLYCRLIVPLPIQKGGRRRLLVSVLDNETRQPVQLPPALAELFHEKNLFELRLLRKSGAATGAGIGSAVKGALGKLFKS